jgi:KipI family sensor histidine kinase inhibitor
MSDVSKESALFVEPRFRLAGDRGLLVEYGEGIAPEVNAKVLAMAQLLDAAPPVGLVEVIPTYRSLLLVYEPHQTGPVQLADALKALAVKLDRVAVAEAKTVEIPVCYGGEHGPDIDFVAQRAGVEVEEVALRHSTPEYPIYMIGFTPGFPFLGGLDESLHAPRLETPRLRVPRGSVGIANGQTGIYPVESPGGWRLIGRTPLALCSRGGSAMKQLFKVLSPGGYTTVQDAGRTGFQRMGVPLSGALDKRAYRIANLLVGNDLEAAALEITVVGPRLEVLAEADVALTGAELPIRLNGEALCGWRSFRVKKGDLLEIGQVSSGCRGYLAVSGGLDVPLVMGSRSTYVSGKLGGHGGRALKADDILAACEGGLLSRPRELPGRFIPSYPTDITVRAVAGPQEEFFGGGLDELCKGQYMITPKADRMGYRIQGSAIPIGDGYPKSIISEPSMPGGVQIPPDGQPIILLVEQTVGGYAKAATVVSCDLDRIAQGTPGDMLSFELLSIDRAHALLREQVNALAEIARLW